MIVDHVEDPEWLEHELAAVAASHVKYGVRPEMYRWVGDALIETLRDACGAEWTDEAESAWRAAYARIEGAVLAALPPPSHA
jgi:hemoglobin-like flavoprotein